MSAKNSTSLLYPLSPLLHSTAIESENPRATRAEQWVFRLATLMQKSQRIDGCAAQRVVRVDSDARHSAVDDERLRVYVHAFIGDQEQRGISHFPRRRHTAERKVCSTACRSRSAGSAAHGRINQTWAERVDAHAARSAFESDVAHESAKRCFGCVIRRIEHALTATHDKHTATDEAIAAGHCATRFRAGRTNVLTAGQGTLHPRTRGRLTPVLYAIAYKAQKYANAYIYGSSDESAYRICISVYGFIGTRSGFLRRTKIELRPKTARTT